MYKARKSAALVGALWKRDVPRGVSRMVIDYMFYREPTIDQLAASETEGSAAKRIRLNFDI